MLGCYLIFIHLFHTLYRDMIFSVIMGSVHMLKTTCKENMFLNLKQNTNKQTKQNKTKHCSIMNIYLLYKNITFYHKDF